MTSIQPCPECKGKGEVEVFVRCNTNTGGSWRYARFVNICEHCGGTGLADDSVADTPPRTRREGVEDVGR